MVVKVGDKIRIRPAKTTKSGNISIAGKEGVVTKLLVTSGKLIGVYADIRVMRKTRNFYIPVNLIEDPGEINKIRTLSILRSTIL